MSAPNLKLCMLMSCVRGAQKVDVTFVRAGVSLSSMLSAYYLASDDKAVKGIRRLRLVLWGTAGSLSI